MPVAAEEEKEVCFFLFFSFILPFSLFIYVYILSTFCSGLFANLRHAGI